MPTLHDIAYHHLDRRLRLAERVRSRALRLWSRVELRDLDRSWDAVAPALTAEVVAGQQAAARMTDPYMRRVAAYYGDHRSAPSVIPEAFSGATLDGRSVEAQMFSAVTNTKTLISAGRPPREAFTVGASFLATVVGTMVSDMGRQSDLVGGVARTWTRYIRVVQPGACSRCAVLAGAASAQVAYLRHPNCKCTTFPLKTVDGRVSNWDELSDTLYGSPEEYFQSLSPAEQSRVFTKSGAEAIRHGADPIQVVNARRGAYGIGYSGHYNPPSVRRGRLEPVQIGVRPDGSPLLVYATTERTTRRGSYGRVSRSVRLMPEQIAVMAGGDPDMWVELLRRYGYLR